MKFTLQRKQRPPPTGGRGQRKMKCSSKKLFDWVCAEISTLAGFAMLAHPYFIELVQDC